MDSVQAAFHQDLHPLFRPMEVQKLVLNLPPVIETVMEIVLQ